MKWWGWGAEDKEFRMEHHPYLWPFVEKWLGDVSEGVSAPPVAFDAVELPEPRVSETFAKEFPNASRDDLDRLQHTYGKSFRDLYRVRRGLAQVAPDLVVRPESAEEVERLVMVADQTGVVLIPFGGGSNVAGCVEARHTGDRTVVSVDLSELNRVLEVDAHSLTASIQAGVYGPAMETQLGQQGVTLGHFPDSFEYSTLGGWIATRSAGMQSDKYGKIEDMVVSLRMASPNGLIVTRPVPRCSNGIDVNHVCIGSEGTLGVITDAMMRVHKIPERRELYGWLFPDFESGVAGVHECTRAGCAPSITRLNDKARTALSFAFRAGGKDSFFKRMVSHYLKRRFDFEKVCLLIIGHEGSERVFSRQKRDCAQIYKKHGGFCLGTAPGVAHEKGKYDFPYIRDWLMDRDVIADVSETATVWSNVLPLYRSVMAAIESAMAEHAEKGFVGCHVSHTYPTGSSLYFTFACKQDPGLGLSQYLKIKKAAEDAFLAGGATLSHHHAVGWEHLPWMSQECSPAGLEAIRSLKRGLDPNTIMNPGKVVPEGEVIVGWDA
ncbi:MAG: FAD-binding oxidoreductase [Planctomycetes bacterium]|nr:FAD-binding oxidoreductase [Planctomycetota bacterium]